jgi:hypothetical protein
VLTVPDIRSVETDFTYPYTGAEDYAPMLAASAASCARSFAGSARGRGPSASSARRPEP